MAILQANPLVSVVIACYNQKQFLRSLFSSLLGQTYSNLEIIFLDDCSLDDTWEASRRYQEQLEAKFTRVHMERNATNLGALRNLEKGFEMVSGDYVSYLEADDYYCATKVERNLEFFESNPSYGAVHSDYYLVQEDLQVLPRFEKSWIGKVPSGWIFDDLLTKSFVRAPTLMVRRDFFLRAFQFALFEKRDYRMGDYPGLLMLSQMTKIGFIEDPLVFYRVLEVSMSHTPVPGEKAALMKAVEKVQRDARMGRLNPQDLAPRLELNRC